MGFVQRTLYVLTEICNGQYDYVIVRQPFGWSGIDLWAIQGQVLVRRAFPCGLVWELAFFHLCSSPEGVRYTATNADGTDDIIAGTCTYLAV
jgi:hypothetical protein